MSNDKIVQMTIVGKVYNENKGKTYRLNSLLEEYFKLIRLYMSIGLELKYMSKSSLLKMRRISIRFDKRTFTFEKKESKLTPYWLTLSTDGIRWHRISLPIQLGKMQIEKLENGWRPSSIEMVKRNGQWFAHITIEKWIKFKEPKTVIGIDIGEVNFASCMAIAIDNQGKYLKGQIWRGEEIKRIRGLYGHIRRSLGRKKLPGKIKEIGKKENRKVNQEVHIIANDIIEYVKQFEDPIISMEDLTNIRYSFNMSKKLNKRFHSLPFYKLKKYVEYKANSEGIDVQFIEPFDTTKTCHKCGNVSHVYGREYRCKVCGMVYNRDLNGSINIAHVLMRDMGWRRSEPLFEPTNENIDVKSNLNIGSSLL